jgi:ADP-ribose pyrophosphatase
MKIPDHAVRVFKGVSFDVYQWKQLLFDGTTTTFEALKHRPAVSIIPVIGDKLVVLREEQPLKKPYDSFCGGALDYGESIVDAAVRELAEETGFTFKQLKLVAIEDIGGAHMEFVVYRFIASVLMKETATSFDGGEKITKRLLSFSTAKRLSKKSVYMSQFVMNMASSVETLMDLPELDSDVTSIISEPLR